MEPETDFLKKSKTKFPKELHHVLDEIGHSCPASCRVRKLGSYVVGSVYSLAGAERAFAFVEAGADGIMIHSRRKEPDEILEFCDRSREKNKNTPIVVVPSSFNTITEDELAAHGVNIVIYANQLTRSAFPAMEQTAKDILKYHRAKEVDSRLMPIKQIISLIDEL